MVVDSKVGQTEITLRNDRARAKIRPDVGGGLTEFSWRMGKERVHWLRPVSEKEQTAANPLEFSCFPLVPYSNRIRNGHFHWEGKAISLPNNWKGGPHPIHGHGWKTPWEVVEGGDDFLTMEYVHPPDAWPFGYRARQRFDLSLDALKIELELQNQGATPMPAGLGFHPYFPRTPKCRVFAGIQQVWLTDAEIMPTERVTPPQQWRLDKGLLVEETALDHVFTEWNRTAVIHWPERNARLWITAEGPLNFLVVFSPQGQDFFCVEPVSHCTDAFNLAEKGDPGTGTLSVAPGESLAVSMTLIPEWIGP